jgi:hypothetical protein
VAEVKAELAAERSFTGRVKQFGKSFGAIMIAGLAGVTGVSAQLFPSESKAKETAAASAAGFTALDQELDKSLAANRAACEAVSAAAVRDAKAEADSVRTLVLGYMLALQSRGGPNASQEGLQKALGEVVAGLGKSKAASLAPILDGQEQVSAAVQLPAPAAPMERAPRKAAARLEQLAK